MSIKSIQLILAILVLQNLSFSCTSAAERTQEVEHANPTSFSIPVYGLPNLGNSCYMNAVLQCLFQVPEFAQLIREENNQETLFLDQCKNIVAAFEQKDEEAILVATTELFEQISECLFDGSDEQQDAFELFAQIINSIPELRILFFLSLNTKISCAECDTLIKSANQTLYDLPLDTFQQQNIKGLSCPNCLDSQAKTHKKSKLNNSPEYILINCDQLYGQNGSNALKNLQAIQSKLSDYELAGTILYAGNKENGHYIAHVRENSTKKWHVCNDMHIVKLNETATQKQKRNISSQNKLVAFFPRMLFYSKKQQVCATKVS